MRSYPLLVLLCVLLISAVQSASAQTLRYSLSFPDASAHYVNVTLKCDASADETELMMPTWTPGSYLMREYARFVENVLAVDEEGESLPIVKTRKNRWTVTSPKGKPFYLSYRVYCHELSVRTNWVEHDLAVLNGAATFLVPVDRLMSPITLSVNLPKQWPRSVCALPEQESSPHTYLAKNFDELVDSPLLCGDCHVFPFQVSGKNHYLVNLGDDESWDSQRAVSDLKKIVAEHHQFWGEVPYNEYYFLNVVLTGGGGLEHDNCTLIMSNRWTCSSYRSYKNWLSLCSHEFFHTWNVRRLRPQALAEYDYENEVYLRQLWIAEGITSYYENLLVARAGILSDNEMLRKLSEEIRDTEMTPGNTQQSLSDSSFDSWIKFYRPHENSRNTTVSYYTRGSIAAFLLDAEIRSRSKNQRSLDDVMVKMYQTYLQGGYTSAQFQAVCSEVAGADLSEWFNTYIERPTRFDYDTACQVFGLTLTGEAMSDSANDVTIGASITDKDGRATITSILATSAAAKAGLNLDDEVIAIEKRRVSSGTFERELEEFEVDDIVEILTARRGKLRAVKVRLEPRKMDYWQLSEDDDPTKTQTKNFARWMGEEPEAKATKDSQGETETETGAETQSGGDTAPATEAAPAVTEAAPEVSAERDLEHSPEHSLEQSSALVEKRAASPQKTKSKRSTHWLWELVF